MMLGSRLSPPSLAFECKRCFPVIGSVRPVGLVANWDCSRENAELCACVGECCGACSQSTHDARRV